MRVPARLSTKASEKNFYQLVIVLALLTLIAPPPRAEAVIRMGGANSVSVSTGLVGYWPLDGATTNWRTNTVADLSGNGHTGTLVFMSTTTSPTAGKIGTALSFNGTPTMTGTSYIELDPSSDFLTGREDNFSLCAWVKLDSNVTYADAGYVLYSRKKDRAARRASA